MPTDADQGAADVVEVSRGNLYLSRELCERHLPGIDAIALLSRDASVRIAPLAAGSAGGLLLKIRNARGDRVVHAQEFCRTYGYAEDEHRQQVAVRWDQEAAVLVLGALKRAGCKPSLHNEKPLDTPEHDS